MTDGKQGAAEWLRGIIGEYEAEKSFNSCSLMAKLLGIECGDTTCRECTAEMMKTVADRIDAERALPEGVEWPRFEDGELVKIGDEVDFDGVTANVHGVTMRADTINLLVDGAEVVGVIRCSYGELVKRPTPKVLDADGVEIRVSDTVYGDDDPEQLIVDSFDGPGCVCVTLAKSPSGMLYTIEPSRLTHERPDSWERLEEDVYHLVMSEYLETPEKDVGDIVRRAKALAKAGEVENDREA